MKKINNEKAITLIALVITVIVLTIISAIVISTVAGDNGIISLSKREKQNVQNKVGTIDERIEKLENGLKGNTTTGEENNGGDELDIVFSMSSNRTWAKTQSTVVSVKNASDVAQIKYQWTQSAIAPDDSGYTNTISSGETITKSDGDGNDWYLWVKAVDSNGDTLKVATAGPFYLDNTGPVIESWNKVSVGDEFGGYGTKITLNNVHDDGVGTISLYADIGGLATADVLVNYEQGNYTEFTPPDLYYVGTEEDAGHCWDSYSVNVIIVDALGNVTIQYVSPVHWGYDYDWAESYPEEVQ